MCNNENKSIREDVLKRSCQKKKDESLFHYIFISFLSILGGIIVCLVLWETGITDKLLFHLALRNGINPTLMVFIISCLLLGISVYSFHSVNINTNKYLPLALFMLSMVIINVIMWNTRKFRIDDYSFTDTEMQQCLLLENEMDGYKYIGYVIAYNRAYSDETETVFLYVKTVEGRLYYYCSETLRSPKILVEKNGVKEGRFRYKGKTYIITFDFDWEHLNVINEKKGVRRISQESADYTVGDFNSYRLGAYN